MATVIRRLPDGNQAMAVIAALAMTKKEAQINETAACVIERYLNTVQSSRRCLRAVKSSLVLVIIRPQTMHCLSLEMDLSAQRAEKKRKRNALNSQSAKPSKYISRLNPL